MRVRITLKVEIMESGLAVRGLQQVFDQDDCCHVPSSLAMSYNRIISRLQMTEEDKIKLHQIRARNLKAIRGKEAK